MKDNISLHCSYKEGIKSATAIKYGLENTPNERQLANMKLVAEKCFEPVRAYFGKPIAITSFFRSHELNKRIGGSGSSQHCEGKAMDIDADVFGGMTNKEIFDFILENLEFDQLIWEFGNSDCPAWVHVSYNEGNNRKQVVRAIIENGRTKYVAY